MTHSHNFSDITGKRFNKLVVLSFAGKDRWRSSQWECRCDCGNTIIVRAGKIKSGHTQSCGCFQKQRSSEASFVHGLSDTKEHIIWYGMRQRCDNKNNPVFSSYGGRGITVCDRWRGKQGFSNFISDMGECPDAMSIERMDNGKDYSPDNCKWATQRQQCNNTRRNRIITYNGITMNIGQWADYLNINVFTLISRLDKSKWSIEKAFLTPVGNRK